MSSSLSTVGPSDSDATSSSSSSCKLSTKMSKALRTHWEAKDLGQSAASGKAHMWHKRRKIGNIRKKKRQPILELLERKTFGTDWADAYL